MPRFLAPWFLLFSFLSLPGALAASNVVPFVQTSVVLGDRTIKVRGVIVSNGADVARDVLLQVEYPEGLTLLEATPAYGWALVRDDSAHSVGMFSIGLDPGQADSLDVVFRVEESFWGEVRFRATSTAIDVAPLTARNAPVFAERLLRVTNANDSGPGSLRNAIEIVNGECDGVTPCRVQADQDLAPIVVASPLPPIAAATARFHGPFEIHGDLLEAGHGIELRPAVYSGERLELYGLRVRNFPGNGLQVTGEGERAATYLVSQSLFNGNRNRGISIDDPQVTIHVDYSETSLNGRSGIVVTAAKDAHLGRSYIADNGASGIFVAGGNVKAHGHDILNHPDFGIAVARGVRASVHPFRMKGNGALDIDIGLDGPTPNDEDESDGVLNAPELLDATYDPATRMTTVRGVLRSNSILGETFYVHLYVGDDVNRFGIANVISGVGGTRIEGIPSGRPFTAEFTMKFEGDARGKLLAAQTQVYEREVWTPTWVSEIAGALRSR